jgi:hypothetical protein
MTVVEMRARICPDDWLLFSPRGVKIDELENQ